jgi:hypothetical protein
VAFKDKKSVKIKKKYGIGRRSKQKLRPDESKEE